MTKKIRFVLRSEQCTRKEISFETLLLRCIELPPNLLDTFVPSTAPGTAQMEG